MLSRVEIINVTNMAIEKIPASVVCLEKPLSTCILSANRNSDSVTGTSEKDQGYLTIVQRFALGIDLLDFTCFIIGAVVEGGRWWREFSILFVKFRTISEWRVAGGSNVG